MAEHPDEVEALAIRDGRIVAIGPNADLDELAAEAATVLDLRGRRVLPGLIDSHVHAVRAGLTWNCSLRWDAMRTIEDCLASIRERAARLPAGSWISVVGGWHAVQLREGRPPTIEELDAAAPEHPVYVQQLYERGSLNTVALRACGWDDASADPQGGTLGRDQNDRLTGEITGMGAFAVPLKLALTCTTDERVTGTRQMTRDLAAAGLTGFHDGFGLMMTPEDHRPLVEVWRRGDLNQRARLFVSPWERGNEVHNIDQVLRIGHHSLGDDMLRIVGIGEVAHLGCHDFEGFDHLEITDANHDELIEIAISCARAAWPMSVHAVRNATLSRVLDAWEKAESETGLVRGRRWSIVHADEASPENLDRIARLGAGILVQNRVLLTADRYARKWGKAAVRRLPPIGDMRARGITIGAGTDAMRANWYSPWASIWWLVTGESMTSAPPRDPAHRLTLSEALAAYTRGSAWFTAEEHQRGRLLPGYFADVCVPTLDPVQCDPDQLRDIQSDLTLLGGRVTHAAGDFVGLAG